MTKSLKTPMTFDKVREAKSFDEALIIENFPVCMITFANDKYYLNAPQVFDEESDKFEAKGIQFDYYQDLQSIDFNGYWIIETFTGRDGKNSKCFLRHFNTGHYLCIEENPTEEDGLAKIQAELQESSEFVFEPVNSTETDIDKFTTEQVFKIRCTKLASDGEDDYLRIVDKKGGDSELVGEEQEGGVKQILVDDQCPINFLDTFNVVFPEQDEYEELIFCVDVYDYLYQITLAIREKRDRLATVDDLSPVIAKVVHQVKSFV